VVTRRTVLKVGLGGAAILAAGGIGLGLRPSVLRSPSRPLRVLSPVEFSVLAAFAERVAPGGRGFPPASQLGVAEKLDDYLFFKPDGVRKEVRQALHLVENAVAGFVLDGRPRTFTASTPAEQDAILEAWRHSRLHVRRTVYAALHGLCAATYYATPSTYPMTGYPGPPSFGNVRGGDPEPASPGGPTGASGLGR
jgi:hypothetical protein